MFPKIPKDSLDLLLLVHISILMEFAVYSFLLFILFLGVIFNLKVTNTNRLDEIKNKKKF